MGWSSSLACNLLLMELLPFLPSLVVPSSWVIISLLVVSFLALELVPLVSFLLFSLPSFQLVELVGILQILERILFDRARAFRSGFRIP